MSLFSRMYIKEGPGVSKDEPKKKGFALFWWIVKSNNTNLLLLNWLFILCCIPIITIGPSIKALSKVTLNLVRQEPMSFFSEFFSEFKENFIKCSFVGFCYLLLIVMSIFSASFYFYIANESVFIYIMAAVILILLHFILASMMFVFNLIAITDISIKNAIKNSFRLIFVSPKEMIIILFLVCIPIYIFFSNVLFGLIGLSLYLIFLFALNSIIISYFSWRALKKHVVL